MLGYFEVNIELDKSKKTVNKQESYNQTFIELF